MHRSFVSKHRHWRRISEKARRRVESMAPRDHRVGEQHRIVRPLHSEQQVNQKHPANYLHDLIQKRSANEEQSQVRSALVQDTIDHFLPSIKRLANLEHEYSERLAIEAARQAKADEQRERRREEKAVKDADAMDVDSDNDDAIATRTRNRRVSTGTDGTHDGAGADVTSTEAREEVQIDANIIAARDLAGKRGRRSDETIDQNGAILVTPSSTVPRGPQGINIRSARKDNIQAATPTPAASRGRYRQRSNSTPICDQCRSQKKGCDRKLPCERCRENNKECSYGRTLFRGREVERVAVPGAADRSSG